MAISLTEVAFFAPFTMGMAAFASGSISNWISNYAEQVTVLQKEARELELEKQDQPNDFERALEAMSHDMQSSERYTTDVLDDVRTINIDKDINVSGVPASAFGIGLRQFNVSAHRARNTQRTVQAAFLVLISITFELAAFAFSDFDIPKTQLTVSFKSLAPWAHFVVMTFMALNLLQTMLSLKAVTNYTGDLSKTLIWGHEAVRKIWKQLDFNRATRALSASDSSGKLAEFDGSKTK